MHANTHTCTRTHPLTPFSAHAQVTPPVMSTTAAQLRKTRNSLQERKRSICQNLARAPDGELDVSHIRSSNYAISEIDKALSCVDAEIAIAENAETPASEIPKTEEATESMLAAIHLLGCFISKTRGDMPEVFFDACSLLSEHLANRTFDGDEDFNPYFHMALAMKGLKELRAKFGVAKSRLPDPMVFLEEFSSSDFHMTEAEMKELSDNDDCDEEYKITVHNFHAIKRMIENLQDEDGKKKKQRLE